MSKFFDGKYVPKYHKNYIKLPWYEKDLMTHYDYLKYKDMSDNPEYYLKNVHVINFDIIHQECCGDKLKGNYKDYKTIKSEDLINYPKKEVKKYFISRLPSKKR